MITREQVTVTSDYELPAGWPREPGSVAFRNMFGHASGKLAERAAELGKTLAGDPGEDDASWLYMARTSPGPRSGLAEVSPDQATHVRYTLRAWAQ